MNAEAIDYNNIAATYITAIKESDIDVLSTLPEGLKTQDEKDKVLVAILEAVEAESDEFKEVNKILLASLAIVKEKQEEAAKEAKENAAEAEDTSVSTIELTEPAVA